MTTMPPTTSTAAPEDNQASASPGDQADQIADQIAETQSAAAPAVVAEKNPGLARLRDEKFKSEVEAALPQHVDAGAFIRHATTLVAQNDKLLEIAKGGAKNIDHMSIVRGVMRAAALGLDLDPTLGQAWLVPRTVQGTKTAIFQVGYKGFLELVYRSGKVAKVEVERVHQNDRFSGTRGTDGRLDFAPDWFGDRGPVIGWYAYAKLTSGAENWVVMSLGDMEAHRDRYALKVNGKVVGPWVDHFEAMADKTVFLKLARWLPKSTELADAIAADPDATETVKAFADSDDDIVDAQVVDPDTGEVNPVSEAQ